MVADKRRASASTQHVQVPGKCWYNLCCCEWQLSSGVALSMGPMGPSFAATWWLAEQQLFTAALCFCTHSSQTSGAANVLIATVLQVASKHAPFAEVVGKSSQGQLLVTVPCKLSGQCVCGGNRTEPACT